MSPSRGEKIDRRQRGAVNSRGASSLVARASRNVFRTSAARVSAADAATSNCRGPAVENAPIVAAGATSAAMIIPTLASAPLHRTRATEALVPRQQERENALQSSLSKRSAETSAAYSTKPAVRTLITPALMVPFLPCRNDKRRCAGPPTICGKKHDESRATKNIKVVVRRWLGNKTSLSHLYVPMGEKGGEEVMLSQLFPLTSVEGAKNAAFIFPTNPTRQLFTSLFSFFLSSPRRKND